MTTRSSIEGSIVANHAEVLNECLTESRPSASVLARYLKPGDLEVLAKPIDETDGFDIQLHQRMMEFLRDPPEILCGTTQGFIDRMAEEQSAPDLWRWERPHLDRIDLRMNRDA
jgi:hypothetical protein